MLRNHERRVQEGSQARRTARGTWWSMMWTCADLGQKMGQLLTRSGMNDNGEDKAFKLNIKR